MNSNKQNFVNFFPCLIYSVLCGVVTGAAIFFFKFIASRAEKLSRYLYGAAKGSVLFVGAVFLALIALAIIMICIHKLIPESKGGGIPRSEGVLRGHLSFMWLRTFIGTVSGSMISFFAGLPLGCEGPAVLIGTSLGGMCVSKSKNRSAWNRYIMTGGAGAGFSVATGAPLSGVLFALEEIHKRFTPMLVMIVSLSIISATSINRTLCNLFEISPSMFHVEPLHGFSLNNIPALILFGFCIALAVAMYDGSIELVTKFTAKYKSRLTAKAKIIGVFVLTGILGFLFTDGIYNGHHVIDQLLEGHLSIWLILAVLVIRFIMMLLSTDSGVTGGTFIPTLAIGALFATLISRLLLAIGISDELIPALILLGMCAFIGGTLRAPLTACVLFVELTGQFTDIFFIALVVFTVNAFTEIIHLTPFYDTALEKMVEAQNEGKTYQMAHFSAHIAPDAFVIGKTVRDVMWPTSTVVLSIKRADEDKDDMENSGEKKITTGDTLVLRSLYYNEEEILAELHSLFGKDADIHKMA